MFNDTPNMHDIPKIAVARKRFTVLTDEQLSGFFSAVE